MEIWTDDQASNIVAAKLDLSNCDREPIHCPGMIQPHGVMLILRPSDLMILQASENTDILFGIAAASLITMGLSALFGSVQARVLSDAIARVENRLGEGSPQMLPQVKDAVGDTCFHALVHRAGDVLLLEIERINNVPLQHQDPYSDLVGCITRLKAVNGLQPFLELAVEEVRSLTGFDRVMAYQFAENGSGQVVAEAKQAGLVGYLGKHFPASDIPAPARRLLALSGLRHLPNVDYAPVPLIPNTDTQVDMSRASLRHVSIMYVGWLKNIRAQATMVLPLMKDGQLWGLLTCMHHAAQLHVPRETRTAVEILAHTISSTMADQANRDTALYRQSIDQAIATLGSQMVQEPNHYHGLYQGPVSLDGWLNAAGVALATKDGIVLLGETPTSEQILEMCDWLAAQTQGHPVFCTDRLPQIYPAAEGFRVTASGLLAVQLVPGTRDFAMWFRPEISRTVEWAGDPRKPVQVDVIDGEERLTPRVSFEFWLQTVSGCSAPWLDCEREAAAALRRAVADIALRRLNEDLRNSNAELESFAHVASHDLKEPLRGIHNFATFLQRSADPKLTEEERERIQTILRLTRRMDALVDALLHYSRAGRQELMLETVDLNHLLHLSLEVLKPRLDAGRYDIRLPGKLPILKTDPVRVGEVMMNLLTNAMKYNSHPAGACWIEIGWKIQGGESVIYVRDNGIGIAPQNSDRVFQIFRRLHARNEFGGGTGVGLTISQRTITRLGGRLWVESEGIGHGSTFLFSLGAAIPEAGGS